MRQLKLWLYLILIGMLVSCGQKPESPQNVQSQNGESPKPTPAAIKIATYTWVGYAPLYLAEEKGFFKKQGVEVSLLKIDDTAARRSALQSGDVHASVNTVDAFSNVIAGGIKAKVVLKLDDSLGGDGLVVDKEITSVQDLKGIEIAYPEGQPSHFFLIKLLQENGMSLKDIITTPMEADQAGVAFMAKSVKAAVTWEPWLTNAVNAGHGRVLASTKDLPVIVDVLTVRNDYLEKNPETIKGVIKAWMDAIEYWKENQEEANAIMAKAMKIPAEEYQLMIQGCKYADAAENKRYFTKNENGENDLTELLNDAGKVWQAEGLIQQPAAAKDADGSEIVLSVVK